MRDKVAFRRVHTGTLDGDQMQRTAQRVAQVVAGQVLTGAKLLDTEANGIAGAGLSFTAGTARSIPHGLGRKAVGFFEAYGVDAPSAAHVGLRPTAHPAGITSSTHITVTAASTGTCLLVVF
jgi:hypothetical protein